ncbi:YceI family protein [uncultured Flavobacterium sp.]|uniref:YceI family protein n=1 Tax=uncultured Flavobacterium sp. TaxID=165435 RepID=UPI0030CA544B
MKGKLEMHGKKKEFTTPIFLRKVANALEIISNFIIETNDFKIKIPSVLSMKVADMVNIETNYLLQ